jgi:predicted DNA-binding WGR domain protein
VYIDSLAGESFEAVLNQVDLNENANTFYCLQLLTSTKTSAFAVWRRWGRIGETGQNALKYYDDLNDAKSAFERKFNHKSGLLWDERFAEPKKGKYTLIEQPGEEDEKAKPSIPLQERVSPPSTLHPKVQKLVEFIFSKMKKGTTVSALNNKFTDEGTDVDRQFLALGLAEATPLDHESDEFKKLQHYYHQSHPGATRADDASGTGYSATIVEDIFRITRKAEMGAFAAVKLKNTVDARKLLWHGSRCSNIGEILSEGLKIAPEEVPVNGHVWGKGIYLTDESRKSWEFCDPSRRDGTALLLLCEVQIGDPVYEVTMIDYDAGEEVREKGLLATVFICWKGWEWVDAGQVNEQLAGVMMPEPSASRKNRGLMRCGYGHNEVCSKHRSHVGGSR